MSGLGEMGNLLKQAQEMQRQIDRVRSELREHRVEGNAGGLVQVAISADRHEVLGVTVSDEALEGGKERVAELLRTALQDAVRRAGEIEKEAIGRVTGGMNLPGLL